jgi:hypothetical protein
MDKPTLSIVGITAVVLVIIMLIATSQSKNAPEPRDTCIEHTRLDMHIHPNLEIFDVANKVAIPSEIGVTPGCMKAMHTHDDTGKLHVEYTEPHDFVLGDFFAVWGQTFSKEQIMDKKADDKHKITMTVDGKPSEDFENLILKDEQKIVIRYEEIK